ncbi:hypothetical protein DY000_02040725 [Brassica cretica]|uniref:Uncharacterized protein n=1 Tax=Brassica cretica TaxID=69181 RepID=A0ABQ7BJS1_BRACR|nr:hypothetical protein DY000_02040725 [Brassica cretica]
MRHAQVLRPPLRESPKLQAPPSPRHRQKPRPSASSTRHQRFKKDSARPVCYQGTGPPPGSECGSGLSGTRDSNISGAMSCLGKAC